MNQTFDSTEPKNTASKDRILDAAEDLFATQGFAETSLRQITTHAGVNLAAVNYYFQSKEQLILAVLLRRIGPINQRRLELLDRLEADANGAKIALEELLNAFFEPVFDLKTHQNSFPRFPQLFGRLYNEPGNWMERVFPIAFAQIADRFSKALSRSMEDAPVNAVLWGMFFSIGAMAHFLAKGPMLAQLSGSRIDANDAEAALKQLVCYTAGGIRAMAGTKEDAR